MHSFTVATLYLIVGGLVFLLGIVILREAPREKANRATALMLFFGGLGSVLGAIGFILEGAGGKPTRVLANPRMGVEARHLFLLGQLR